MLVCGNCTEKKQVARLSICMKPEADDVSDLI
jgi:hypothetical protein